MSYGKRARTTPHRIRRRRSGAAGLLIVIAAIAAALGYRLPASSSSTAAAPIDVPRTEHRGLPSEHRGPLGEADGAVPEGATVFADEIPGVANLDPDLLGALRLAATDAADDGVEFVVDSGWRSPEYQDQLLREAVSEYGSEEEAARWVATAETSAHVSGDAVDLGPDATAWLSEHGAEYGLCQIYDNEPWHYELRRDAVAHGCPPVYADPTHDPRMQAAAAEGSLVQHPPRTIDASWLPVLAPLYQACAESEGGLPAPEPARRRPHARSHACGGRLRR